MTDREKIISLARECGFEYVMVKDGIHSYWTEKLEAFYHKTQKQAFEQAAKISASNEVLDNHPCKTANNIEDAIRQLIKE